MTITSGAADASQVLTISVPKISIEGTPLPDDQASLLLSMTVETCIGRPDLCELSFAQPSDQQGTPSNDIPASWAPGKALKIEASDRTVLFEGEVTSVDFLGSVSSSTTVVLLAYDKRHRMFRKESVKVCKDQSFKDIVTALLGEVGLQHDLSGLPSTVMKYYLHEGTVGDLVDRLCDEYGLYHLNKAGKVVVKKASELTEEAGTIQASVELMEFRLRQTTSSDRAKAEVRGWDPKTKEAIVGTKPRANGLPGTTPEGPQSQSAFGFEGNLFHTAHVSAQAEADARALGVIAGNVDAGMQLDATTFFLPKMTAGKLVEVKGIPTRFAGKYRLTSVRHQFDPDEGGRSYLVCRGAGDLTLPGLLQQAVLEGHTLSSLGGGHGLQPALVTNVKSAPGEGALGDQGAAGEVKVKLPWLGDNIESGWLRVVTVGGGNDRGFFVMPEVNDEVLVAFHNGDMRSGYVLGGLYNGQDKAPRSAALLTDGSKIQERVWRSRTGHEIVLGDKEGSEYVQIKTKGDEMVVRLDVKEKLLKITGDDITIENKGKVTIKSTGEISVKSDADLKMEAMNIELKAQQNVKVEGLQVSINGQTGAEVKGAKVDITAQGPATVKGNPIMLN